MIIWPNGTHIAIYLKQKEKCFI